MVHTGVLLEYLESNRKGNFIPRTQLSTAADITEAPIPLDQQNLTGQVTQETHHYVYRI